MSRLQLVVLVFSLPIAATMSAQAAPVPPGRAAAGSTAPHLESAPIRDIRYDVSIDSAGLHDRSIGVAMTFRVAGPGPVILALPAWSPGHYTLLWFARRVSHFAATTGKSALPWRHLDYETWRIDAPAGSTVRVSFAYRADTVDRAVAWTAPDFAFFNGTNLFLYPVGRGFAWPATVVLHLPADWRVATGMVAVTPGTTYAASTFHDLVDMPFFVGHFALDSIETAGHWVRFALYPDSAGTTVRLRRYLDWFAKLVPVEGAVFKEVPWNTYTALLFADTVVNGGGLEHQSSQLDEMTLSELDVSWLPWLFSHELFHSWNVKRLRPADLWPYRYDDAQPTGWLWVSEGITDYYADLATLRAGIDDSTAFLTNTARKFMQVASAPPVAPADASMSAWIDPLDGTAGIYYAQGSLAGFALDIMIRDGSNNRHSLDDVMHELYRDAYKHGRGFTPADWWGAVSHAAGGASFADFARQYIEGRETLPWGTILPRAGLRLVEDTVWAPQFGIDAEPDSAGARVDDVLAGSALAAAGVVAGDTIISIGTVAMRDAAAWDALQEAYGGGVAGSPIPVVVRHRGDVRTIEIPLELKRRPRARLRLVDDAPARAVRVRTGLFHGTTAP